jgi:hypothetical protein
LSGSPQAGSFQASSAAPDIQWVESYVAADKTFCAPLAKNEAVIRKDAETSGLPVTRITEISKVIDPTAAGGQVEANIRSQSPGLTVRVA